MRVIQRILNAAFGEGSLWDDARYNRQLYRSGRANKSIVQHTTIGWRPDPNGDDGFTPDPGNSRVNKDGRLDTASGNVEYHRRIPRGGR